MKTCFVTSGISLGMFQYSGGMRWEPLAVAPREFLSSIAMSHDIVHAIGHKDLAMIAGFPFRRESVEAYPGDILLVCVYRGPRIPEGATTAPDGALLSWYRVEVVE